MEFGFKSLVSLDFLQIFLQSHVIVFITIIWKYISFKLLSSFQCSQNLYKNLYSVSILTVGNWVLLCLLCNCVYICSVNAMKYELSPWSEKAIMMLIVIIHMMVAVLTCSVELMRCQSQFLKSLSIKTWKLMLIHLTIIIVKTMIIGRKKRRGRKYQFCPIYNQNTICLLQTVHNK